MQFVALGFMLHKRSFLRSAFNILDLVVVGVSLISYPFQ